MTGTFQYDDRASGGWLRISAVFSRDCKVLGCSGGPPWPDGPGEVSLWDVGSGKRLAILKDQSTAVTCAAFSLDGSLLAYGGWDGTIHLRDLHTILNAGK